MSPGQEYEDLEAIAGNEEEQRHKKKHHKHHSKHKKDKKDKKDKKSKKHKKRKHHHHHDDEGNEHISGKKRKHHEDSKGSHGEDEISETDEAMDRKLMEQIRKEELDVDPNLIIHEKRRRTGHSSHVAHEPKIEAKYPSSSLFSGRDIDQEIDDVISGRKEITVKQLAKLEKELELKQKLDQSL